MEADFESGKDSGNLMGRATNWKKELEEITALGPSEGEGPRPNKGKLCCSTFCLGPIDFPLSSCFSQFVCRNTVNTLKMSSRLLPFKYGFQEVKKRKKERKT